MCGTRCPAKKIKPDPEIERTFQLMKLQDAGYPFEKNDLELDEWFDIADIRNTLKEIAIENSKKD